MHEFLNPFVNEMESLYADGLSVKSQQVAVSIRCLPCDTPARSFMKGKLQIQPVLMPQLLISFDFFIGTMGHNGKHGCTKCTTVGEWSTLSHTTVFPQLDAPKRTDADFRAGLYYGKHQHDKTPLLRLENLDIVKDLPIGDSLHLLDHGITSKMLHGLIEGKLHNVNGKWSEMQKNLVSKYLDSIKSPFEIRELRPIRNLGVVNKWKAIEFRHFGLYVDMVVLKNNVKGYIYKHLLLYFCAINIISSKHHFVIL